MLIILLIFRTVVGSMTSMVKSLSSERTLSLINLILRWFSYALIIFSTTTLSLFDSYFELILTGAVPVVFCTKLI